MCRKIAVTRTFISCLEFHTKPGLKYIIFEENTFTVLHHSLLYCFRSEIVLLEPEFLSLLPWLPLPLAGAISFSQVNLEIFCRIKQQHFYSQILNPDDDRIVSHDAPRFMLYYHCVRDRSSLVIFSTRKVNIDRSARCGCFPNMFRFSSLCF